jgi:DNA polymerase-1
MYTADTLAAISDELAAVLLEYRSEKKLSDYVAGLWKHAHGDRLYGTFRQCGTDTGRMSSASPNLQNIPKSDLRVRYTICAGEGKVLVGADLDNAELRVLAAFAPGGALEQAFASGVDLHQQTADAVGISREEGKRLGLSIIYGAGAPLISKRLGVDAGEAKAILDRWYATYPEVGRLKAKLTRQVREHGYLTSVGGRRHYFETPNHMLLNRLVSGSCADLFKVAAIELHELGVPVVLYVHDEIVAEVPISEAARIGKQIEVALARGAGPITNLAAKASWHERWSAFKDPEWKP